MTNDPAAACVILCNRSACRAPGATYFNASTQQWYCEKCAKRINETAPELCSLTVRTYSEWKAIYGDKSNGS